MNMSYSEMKYFAIVILVSLMIELFITAYAYINIKSLKTFEITDNLHHLFYIYFLIFISIFSTLHCIIPPNHSSIAQISSIYEKN